MARITTDSQAGGPGLLDWTDDCAPLDWFEDALPLIWLDGDMVFCRDMTQADLEDMAPRGEWLAWLDRDGTYPETGFVMFNRRHPRHAELMAAYRRMYESDALFGLPEWHDALALAHVVEANLAPVKSLSGAARRKRHPAVQGPLGKWLDHLKGNRKQAGESRERGFRR